MNNVKLPKIVVIAGTNASGKSSLGIELAKKYDGEIVSADSRQIFNNFDLCCGKVTAQEMTIVPHHLINIRDVGDNYSVSDYQKDAYDIIDEVIMRNRLPFIVGGTGLYISSVVYGYNFNKENIDYDLRSNLELKSLDELKSMLSGEASDYFKDRVSEANNKRRIIRAIEKIQNGECLKPRNSPKYDVLQIGVTWPKEILHNRIEERLSTRLKQGMLDEIKHYLDDGNDPQILYDLGLEYRYIMWYLTGKYNSFEMFYDDLSRAIKKFAKRQMTWFRKDLSINWLNMSDNSVDYASNLIDEFLKY